LASIGTDGLAPTRHRVRHETKAHHRPGRRPPRVSLTTLRAETAQIARELASPPSVAPSSDEDEVRQAELARLEPRTPEIWRQFRTFAYAHLPNHDRKNFHAVWVAMPVTTPDETVAGVGLKGMWW
jgi:hypothetical protein